MAKLLRAKLRITASHFREIDFAPESMDEHARLRHGTELVVVALDRNETAAVTYGLRLNCVAHGCDPHHADDGQVSPRPNWTLEELQADPTVNGHAADVVEQLTTPWTEVQ